MLRLLLLKGIGTSAWAAELSWLRVVVLLVVVCLCSRCSETVLVVLFLEMR